MTAEFARNRIVKIRNDYSKHDLKNKLGLINNKENTTSEIYASWNEIR